MWVYAKTDESDVGNIRPGPACTFKVDAFPKDTFQGTVSQVRMNPTMVQSVVTYDTIIEFSNPELKLFPGMTAYVTIPVATVKDGWSGRLPIRQTNAGGNPESADRICFPGI